MNHLSIIYNSKLSAFSPKAFNRKYGYMLYVLRGTCCKLVPFKTDIVMYKPVLVYDKARFFVIGKEPYG